ncbi:serpin family protein [Endozoicomonas sp. 4G]|uniref:serpin family protein n=1 Tax=Endozoicomonas sp. 4G TaxID=2872754 RepID=UPI0020791082|nr:serpin family protein [Endozoicomonas sp. 4G]
MDYSDHFHNDVSKPCVNCQIKGIEPKKEKPKKEKPKKEKLKKDWEKPCSKCGIKYDHNHFGSCPISSCGEENPSYESSYESSDDASDDSSDDDFEYARRPSQAATTNPYSSLGAQAVEPQGTLALAVNIFSQAAQQISGNFVISPDGLFQTLALLLLGADGDTEQMLQNCLGEDYSEPDGATASGATASGTTASGTTTCAQDEYCVANCLLVSSNIQLQETYQERLKQINADTLSVNFSSHISLQIVAQALNKQFCELTHGMVEQFCNASDWQSDTTLALISSVYFKGLWEKSLKKRPEGYVFFLPDGEIVNLERFMDGEITSSQYADYNNWQAVTLPYQGDHEMVLILPPDGTMPHEVTPEIIAVLFSVLDSQESCASDSKADVGLPPFKVCSRTDLAKILSATNSRLSSLFTTPLSLGAMLTDPVSFNTNINKLDQNCVIEVDEEGTRAAAVTHMTGLRCASKRKSIQFRRPFLYILRERGTGRIKFIGQILDPRDLGAGTSGS